MSLADAQTLAIRRLLSKSAYENNVSPGPPLPKSHPPPALLAKLHIECASFYSSARLLAKTPGSTKSSSGKGLMGSSPKEVSADLRHYLGNHATLHSALSHKWLGVEAGEKGGTERGGDAVGFLQWAKKELDEIKDTGKFPSFGQADKDKEERWKATVSDELEKVNLFLKYYKKMNDTVRFLNYNRLSSLLIDTQLHFQPMPTQQELQSRIPGGRIAIPAKPYSPPLPAFGPGSLEYTRRKAEQLDLDPAEIDGKDEPRTPPASGANYAGAGSYF